jgi:hypothetical protein
MNAQPGDNVVLSRKELRRRVLQLTLAAFLFGVLVGALFGSNEYFITVARPVVVDKRMEVACRWPRMEGEFLWVMVRHGKVDCGIYN